LTKARNDINKLREIRINKIEVKSKIEKCGNIKNEERGMSQEESKLLDRRRVQKFILPRINNNSPSKKMDIIRIKNIYKKKN